MDAYYTAKLAEGLSGTSVRGHHRVLSSAFGKAVKQRRLLQNPCLFATPPDADTPETVSPDEEDVRLLLGRAKHESPYYPLYLAAAHVGPRQSELAGLTWPHVDLDDKAIRIQGAFLRLGGEQVWKGPKNKGSRRPIAITEPLISVLRAVNAEQTRAKEILGICPEGKDCRNRSCPAYHDLGLVFCQGNGKPLHMRNVYQRDYVPLLERAGLRSPSEKPVSRRQAKRPASRGRRPTVPQIVFHSLRHSNISTAARAGVDLSVTQRRVGHTTPAMILGTYRHVLEQEDRDAARAIAARLTDDSDTHFHSDGQKDGQMDGQIDKSRTDKHTETQARYDSQKRSSRDEAIHKGERWEPIGNA